MYAKNASERTKPPKAGTARGALGKTTKKVTLALAVTAVSAFHIAYADSARETLINSPRPAPSAGRTGDELEQWS